VILARTLGIEAQIKLIVPTKFEARLRQRIVPKLRPRPTLGQIGRMRCDFVSDDARTNILFIRKTKVFFGSYIAEHRSTVPSNLGRTNRARDVIVAGGDVGDERPQSVNGASKQCRNSSSISPGCAASVRDQDLQSSLVRHVSKRVLSTLRAYAIRRMGFIIGVINRAGAKTIAQTERNVISLHNFADFIEIRVEEVLLMVSRHHFAMIEPRARRLRSNAVR